MFDRLRSGASTKSHPARPPGPIWPGRPSRSPALAGLLAWCLAAAALVAIPSSTAAADLPSRIVLRDQRGDVWKWNPTTDRTTKVGAFPAADVLSAVVTHRRDAIAVQMRIADIKTTGWNDFWVYLTTGRATYDFDLWARPGRQGTVDVYRGTSDTPNMECPGLTHSIGYATNVMTMRIPRSCIGNPAWVRVALDNGFSPPPDDAPWYVDNPHNVRAYFYLTTSRLYRA